VAALLVLLLTVAALGIFLAIHQYARPTSLVWAGCSGRFECSTVKVPLDYANPAGDTIQLAVIRLPATNTSHRIGALVLGTELGSGVAFLRQSAGLLKNLNARFDLVGFDARGVGQSSPVRCLSDSQRDSFNALDTVLDDPNKKQAFVQAERTFAQACNQRSGKILPFVDTASSARDLDLIRSELGDAKLTYFGLGYGTFLGQMYAHLFPARARALALDGIVDPTLSNSDMWLQQAAGFEANLQAFVDYCRGFVGCELAKSGDPAAAISALMQRLEQNPLQVGNRILTRQLAMAAVELDLYDPRYWASLDPALSNALNGDGQWLLTLADLANGRHGDGSYASAGGEPFATLCLDRPAPSNVGAYDQLGPAFAHASPFFGPAFQYGALACAYWPVKPKSSPGALTANGAPPILLIGGTEDPVTPYAWAQAVNKQLPGSVLLTRQGYGSTSYNKSLCVRDATAAYLTDLTLPAADTICYTDVV
jgi:pimeloyl-ACP methyl ester carboxylesterase